VVPQNSHDSFNAGCDREPRLPKEHDPVVRKPTSVYQLPEVFVCCQQDGSLLTSESKHLLICRSSGLFRDRHDTVPRCAKTSDDSPVDALVGNDGHADCRGIG